MRMHVFAATVRLTFCLQPISFKITATAIRELSSAQSVVPRCN